MSHVVRLIEFIGQKWISGFLIFNDSMSPQISTGIEQGMARADGGGEGAGAPQKIH